MTAEPQTPRYRGLGQHRRDILTESLLAILNIAVLVWLVDRQIPAYWKLDRALSLTVSFVLVQTALIGLLLVAMFGLKAREGLRTRTRLQIGPQAVAAVTAIARGETTPGGLNELRSKSPAALDAVLADALAAQKGAGQERLATAAVECGAVDAWRSDADSPSAARRCEAILRLSSLPPAMAREDLQRALDDPEELVTVEASRALLRRGTEHEARIVFDSLPRQSVLVQALMVAALRRHVASLAAGAIPEALESQDVDVLRTALRALRTWKRLTPIRGIGAALRHPVAEVRAMAFEALTFVLTEEAPVEELRTGLRDEDETVRAAAAATVGRRALAALLPDLASLANAGGEAGREAANALTALGEAGVAALEASVLAGGSAATTATEALERYRLGRREI